MDILKFFLESLPSILNFLQLKYDANMFQQHPRIVGIAVISLMMFFLVIWMKLNHPGNYENYLGSVPFVENLLRCLSMGSIASLLLPGYVRPLVFIVCLVHPVKKAFYWIFTKMDEHFGDTEFWRRRVHPALYCLRRSWLNRGRRNILPF